MKVCFLLQRRFAFLCHYAAVLLKKKYGLSDVCGYVYLRSSFNFLKQQQDIIYSSLLLDEDIHDTYLQEPLDLTAIERLEQELGLPTLWPYIALDRVLMSNQPMREYPYHAPKYSYADMLRIFQVKARAVLDFLDDEKPNAIFFPNIGGIVPLLLYHLAKKRGIKILHIHTSSLKDKYLLSEAYDSYTGVESRAASRTYRPEQYEEAKKILADFRSTPQPYYKELSPDRQPVTRHQQLRFLLPNRLWHSVRWFYHILISHVRSQERFDYSYVHPWDYLKDRIKRKIRNLRGVADLYDTFDPMVPYAFYGLHYEPEVSLLLLSPFNQNQIEVIRAFARSLPAGYVVYVKEHPQMVPFRPRAYYKELKTIPNVRLIDPAIKSFELIRNARLVTTISGTIGWEALLLKKPVISIGHQFYNCLPMVAHTTDLEQLPRLVQQQLTQFKYDEKALLRFMAALMEESVTLPFLHLWEQETSEENKKRGIEPLADLIAKHIGLTPLV